MSLDLIEIVQQPSLFDYSEYSPDLAASLERHATNMEGFTKRYASNMGKELAEAKAEMQAEKGNRQVGWGKWVEGRLGITVQWADKIIRRYEEEKSETKFQSFSLDQHGMGQSKVIAWNTPAEIVDEVEEMFGVIDVDPASNSKDTPNVPAITRYTEDDDGLAQLWKGRVFLNPPYGREIGEWIEKLVQEYRDGNIQEAIALVPGRTDTQWFRVLFDYPLCFISGRVRYSDGEGAAPFPSVLVYMGTRIDDFVAAFKHRGPVLKRVPYA